jgi:hypothetical protein
MIDIAAEAGLIPESDYLAFAKIGKRTAANQRSDGTSPPFVRVGKKIFYSRKGILEYLAARAVTHDNNATLVDAPRRRRLKHD